MDLIEQKDKLDILNVDTRIIKKTSRHGPLLPDTIRAIIVGPSGSDDIKGANIFIFSDADKNIKPNLTKKNSVIIFDDVLCGPQSIIREYFGMCRHSGASSVFYLAQTYSKIPKQLDDTNLKHIFNDHSSADMDFSEFRKISHFCWNQSDYGFMVIDKTREMNEDKIDILKETDILSSLFSMNKDKVLLKNLILSKKNIKRKIMNMKRGVIDSDNYFRETFIPLLKPLTSIPEKNTSFISDTTKKKDTLITSDGDSENESNSSFDNFLISNPKLQRYDKSYGMHYDSVNDQLKISDIPVTFDHGNLRLLDNYYPWTKGLWSLLCEKVPKNMTIEDMESYYNILKTSKVYLKADGKPKTSRYFKWMNVVKPLYDRMKIEEKQLNEEVLKINNKVKTPSQLKLKEFDNFLFSSSAKRRNIVNDATISNVPFDFSSSVISSKFEEPPTDQLFKFSLSPSVKKGSGLYKDVIPHTQLVYYDDPNELVVRLNLLTSSQNAGNTGVNNEIISIIEELQGLANELHRPARKVFPRRSIITRFKDDLWQADLMDMQSHSKQNLDTYTKYVWVESLKNKTGKECTKGTWNWYNRISKIIYNYNHTKHRSIKCTPYEARINTRYTPNWTTEIFTVSKVLHTESITYQLKDGSNNIILGGFYEQEIKLTDFPNTFLIERVIKKVKDKMLIKWMGFDSTFLTSSLFTILESVSEYNNLLSLKVFFIINLFACLSDETSFKETLVRTFSIHLPKTLLINNFQKSFSNLFLASLLILDIRLKVKTGNHYVFHVNIEDNQYRLLIYIRLLNHQEF
ncbi:hypothetical protein AGLY_007362 [Aphis glycines]|uniref:DUF8207 domain-containing protein n=1 Tax=Aphis glycines TaxID=307491 RepID=A0A6G0TNZ6_APHGL|nr:hypothetical protein AGLY_007362 [Aphis glycines]